MRTTGRLAPLIGTTLLIGATMASSACGEDEPGMGIPDSSRLNDARASDAGVSSDGALPPSDATLDADLDGSPDATADAAPPCEGTCLLWPIPGVRGDDWVINNYVDLDPSRGMRDYIGNVGRRARTYNGHNGVDIDIANFRAMDRGFDVVAATPGRVRRTVSDQMDRNISCFTSNWNVVEVDGDDGRLYLYGHLRRDSVVVSVGERVTMGQKLGEVGSSGCSSAAHLHFEVRDASGAIIDPFLTDMWSAAPSYDTPYRIMDISVRAGNYRSVDELKDPGDNLMMTPAGSRIGVGISAAGGVADDALIFELLAPDGSLFSSFRTTLNSAGRHSWWYWNVDVGTPSGDWTVLARTEMDRASLGLRVTP